MDQFQKRILRNLIYITFCKYSSHCVTSSLSLQLITRTPTGSNSRKQCISLVMKQSRHTSASVGTAASYFSIINCQAVSNRNFQTHGVKLRFYFIPACLWYT